MLRRLALLALLIACDRPTDIPDHCNPLGGDSCMLPWPSMIYAKPDGISATLWRLEIPSEAMPVSLSGSYIHPGTFNRRDGFSTIGPMLAMFASGVSAAGLPADPEASLAASSPIVVLDMTTGQRVPFFAELDHDSPKTLIIRPLVRLAPGHRHAVAIRNTLRAADGGELPVSAAFRALLDGGDHEHPRFEKLAPRYPAIFDALAAAGIERDELTLAWDFVTATDEMLRTDLTVMREAARPVIADSTFATLERHDSPTHERLVGTYTTPDFLSDGEADTSILLRDDWEWEAHPVLRGLRDARFIAVIPKCGTGPRPAIVFGHGLFGSATESLDDPFVLRLAQDHCTIVVAGDFIGLTSRQRDLASIVAADLNRTTQITEKLAQSTIDFMTLAALVRGPLGSELSIDPARVSYVGASLGGSMGPVILAHDTAIDRGVLATPGGNWSAIFERSAAWEPLVTATRAAYDPDVYQLNLAMLGMSFEPYDPMTFAARVEAPLLLWYALGDSQIPNLATEMLARELAIPVVGPSVASPWGLRVAPGPMPSGAVVFDEHPTPMPPAENLAGADNGTHASINLRGAASRLVGLFLVQDKVVGCALDQIAVPCDCGTGACD